MKRWLQPAQVSLFCAGFVIAAGLCAADGGLDTAQIEQLTGRKGTLKQQENVFKVSFPPKDFQATVGGSGLVGSRSRADRGGGFHPRWRAHHGHG